MTLERGTNFGGFHDGEMERCQGAQRGAPWRESGVLSMPDDTAIGEEHFPLAEAAALSPDRRTCPRAFAG